MVDFIVFLDTMAAQWMPAPARVMAWGFISAALSMGVYAFLSPQQKIRDVKSAQKLSRRDMLAHDGDFDALWVLIRKDLGLSLEQLRLVLLPFVISLLPLVLMVPPLFDIYIQPLVTFGPEWMQGFEFWYIANLIIASLVIKFFFKID